ncbi:hypothetical protein [Phenylobacterium sp. 58.2.17]|uniref:hypothetical protein n=1 Tax=Phenylobacterium sp. 58.2.17 TaxID=2969306 RepID=UPI002263DA2D|nr:hypothetical protein [Phenylobacterium sp. 58.2.17]MCX7585063.1 hypothetical protein [Phenylobacterium sp. 58.2.17]
MSGKLTKAQRELLELGVQGELEISHNHPVAHELDALGLLQIGGMILRGGGILFSRSAKITEAGRALLTDTQQGAET